MFGLSVDDIRITVFTFSGKFWAFPMLFGPDKPEK